MHHPNSVRNQRNVRNLIVVSCALSLLLSGAARAQQPAARPATGLIVPLGTSKQVQMAKRRPITKADNPKPAVVGGQDRIINMMQVSGVMQVQLDCVIAQVNRTEGRNFGFNFFISGQNAVFGSSVGGITGQLPTVGTVPPSTFNNGGNGGQAQ